MNKDNDHSIVTICPLLFIQVAISAYSQQHQAQDSVRNHKEERSVIMSLAL